MPGAGSSPRPSARIPADLRRCLPGWPSGYQPGMTYEQMQTELEELERRGWDSLCEGTGADFYGSILTEDGVMVLANGMTMDHDDVVEALRAAPTWDRYEIADVRVVAIEPDAAALVYKG